jgi:hypothetical protein
MKNETNKKQFNGFKAYVNGKPVFVVNKGVNKSGEKILKVRFGRVVGYNGYSGGCYPVYDYGTPVWVLACNVETRKQLQARISEPVEW